ncbi:hypothetical protein ACFQBQ_13350 [Granulicella cerasi]|uniref:Uncharacterized protein n=1 Tax=Granulicella cerasi TaxID=741063 RepID=A0ABW1ZAP2_9BACT
MSHLNRRQFVFATAAAAVSVRALAQTTSPVVLTLHPEQLGAKVPSNFIGLSYETQQLSDPNFFSTKNTGLIATMEKLAPHGVLRIGGNTSDVGWWKATPESKQPEVHLFREAVGEPSGKQAFAITPEAIRNLRGFLDATGWSCLYGINLGTNTPARAAEESAFVAKTLGAKLQYFQVGNEPDLFKEHMRDPKTWSADKFFDEWLAVAQAIMKVVPSAQFAIPDTSGNPEWYAKVVDRWLALPPAERPKLAALSHHYYFGGPPANPDVNIDRLLKHSEKVDTLAKNITAAAARINVPYRMTEGNTCYRGGKPGVSDVFAASLWAADYALTLAKDGYAGVNLHGGGGDQVAASLGGTLPGEALMKDPKEPHARPFYTPIAYVDGQYVPEPTFFGLLFGQQFAGAQMIGLDFAPGANATAYAAKLANGKMLVAIINKDEKQAVSVNIPGAKDAAVATLTADSLLSKTPKWTGGRDFSRNNAEGKRRLPPPSTCRQRAL